MKHIRELTKVPPSSSPPLDVNTLHKLPRGPVLHFEPRSPIRDVQLPHVRGVAKLIGDQAPFMAMAWEPRVRGVAEYIGDRPRNEMPEEPETPGSGWGNFHRPIQQGTFTNYQEVVDTHTVRYLKLTRISCKMTEEAVRDRTKTVTRRLSSRDLLPGRLACLTDGSRRPGVLVLATVVIESVKIERLNDFPEFDLAAEGLPDWDRELFIKEFRATNRIPDDENPEVARIEYTYL